MNTLTLPAPAKINRFLHIVGQREDGYHELQTIFQFIDLADELSFTLRNDRKIVMKTVLNGVSDRDNLVLRAAHALQEAVSRTQGVEISLTKNIPIGGGLGGGSSDAATTLVALNQLWQTKLSITQLIQIGARLGADVPIFIHGHSAWAEGIGDQLTDIILPETWLVLIAPPVKVSTAEIFFNKSLSRDTSRCKMSASLIDLGHNDCEPVVRQSYPEVAKALDWLNELAPARMTGSGGCIFAPVDSQQAALEIVQQAPENYQGFAVKALNISPLHNNLK